MSAGMRLSIRGWALGECLILHKLGKGRVNLGESGLLEILG